MATNADRKGSSAASQIGSNEATVEERVWHFYQNDRVVTECSGKGTRHILWSQGIAMAQLDLAKAVSILQVDHANSVLGMADDVMAYTPYGHFEAGHSATLLAFNGQRFDLIARGYALGNGYRTYSPSLARFCSPDTLSPFSNGGLNAYSYCEGDPVNRIDPSGHFSLLKPRTWFRTSETKVAQRDAALKDMTPAILDKVKKLEDLQRKYHKNSPLDLEKEDKLEMLQLRLDVLLTRAERKVEGIAKHKTIYPPYKYEEISNARFSLQQSQEKKQAPIIKTNAKRSYFSPRKTKDDPYDDTNYQNRQFVIRNG